MTDRLLLPLLHRSSGPPATWSARWRSTSPDPLPLLAARFTLAALLLVPLALRHGRWRGAPLGRLAVIGVLLQIVQFGGVYGGLRARRARPRWPRS